MKINLDRTKNGKFKVTYIPSENAPSLPIKFRTYSRLCYFPLLKHSFISKPKAFGVENNKIKVVKDGQRYSPVGSVAYWEYEIDTEKFPDYVNLNLQSKIQKRKQAYLYPSLFYPEPDGKDLNHKISIRDAISEDSFKIVRKEFTEYLDIDEFVYSATSKHFHFSDSSKKFEIRLSGKFSNLEYAQLESITGSLINAFEHSTGYKVPNGFTFHFVERDIDYLDKSRLPVSSVFKNSISILIDESLDEYAKKEHIIRQCMWQLFRWLSPIHSHDKSWANLNPASGNHSIHLWYYESLTEYLSLICLIENKLITESFFTQIIQDKITKGLNTKSYSLIQLGTDFSTQSGMLQIRNNLKVYDILSNRGVISALLLDIVLLNESNGYGNLMQKFIKTHDTFLDSPFPSESFLGIFSQGHSKDFKLVVEKYIIGIDQFQLKSYFDLIDWQYFRKGEVHKSFIKRGYLTYFPEISKYVCTKSGKNSVGLEKGDIILAINNESQISTFDLNEIILPSKGFRNADRIKIEILRNGKAMVLRGKAEYKAKVKDDIIIPLFNPNSDGYQLRKAMLH